MTSFKDVPKVPLVFLISAAERAKDWKTMKTQIIGERSDSALKVDRCVTEYHPHFPYSRQGVLKNHHSLFLTYSRVVDDTDKDDVPAELREKRVYSLGYFNAYYSEREADDEKRIRNVWQKVDGIYRLIWG